MSDHSETCGLFGKTPQHADFISHFLPDDMTEYWHTWLQSSLSVSREQLGDQWMDYYLTSPVWRFAIMPNIVTPQALVGVMIPSVDEIGRYFPLTIAHLGAHQPWAAYLHGSEWFQAAEDTALIALEENTTYMQLIGQFEALEKPEFEAMPDYQTNTPAHTFNHNQVIEKPSDTSAEALALGLLNKAYTRMMGNHSLWWTEGSEHVDACLLASANLPDPGQFAAMLDGDWQQWGWSQEMIIDEPATN